MDLGKDFVDLNKRLEILGGILGSKTNFGLDPLVKIYINLWSIIERGGQETYAHILTQCVCKYCEYFVYVHIVYGRVLSLVWGYVESV